MTAAQKIDELWMSQEKRDSAKEINFDPEWVIPEYNPRDYAYIAQRALDVAVKIPGSRKYSGGIVSIEYAHNIPRNLQQRMACGNCTGWQNIVMIFNTFAEQKGHRRIGRKITAADLEEDQVEIDKEIQEIAGRRLPTDETAPASWGHFQTLDKGQI